MVERDDGVERIVAYDNRGNVTTLGNLTFLYDKADQPIVVSSGVNANYIYDGNLKRVKSVTNGKTIYNVYDAAGRLAHVDEVTDGKETDYLHGMGQTIARIQNNVFTYLHPDHLGSAQSATDRYGNVLWREYYTPFGETLLNPTANDNQSGFTGHIKDSDTGLNYMQARYYDPNIGRFLSIDPVDFTASGNDPRYFNRYSYTFNDPINNIDPDGMQVVQDGVLKVTVSIGASLGAGATGVSDKALGAGGDFAVELGFGPASESRGKAVPFTRGMVTVDAIGAAGTSIEDGTFQGVALDLDIGEVGVSLGDIDDRAGSGSTVEIDAGNVGAEFTSTGQVAGSTLKISRFGPLGAANVSETKTETDEHRFDQREQENF